MSKKLDLWLPIAGLVSGAGRSCTALTASDRLGASHLPERHGHYHGAVACGLLMRTILEHSTERISPQPEVESAVWTRTLEGRPVKRLVEKHHHAYAGKSSEAHPMLVVVTDETAYPFVGFDMDPASVHEALSLIENTDAVDTEPKLVILSALVEYYELYEDEEPD